MDVDAASFSVDENVGSTQSVVNGCCSRENVSSHALDRDSVVYYEQW